MKHYRPFLLTLAGALVAACTGNPGQPIQGARQDCAACMEENPGDVRVCERICHEHEGNTDGSSAGSVLR